jgi:acyl-CoA synthetase (AMP-forming)/AMP-acid ligase II
VIYKRSISSRTRPAARHVPRLVTFAELDAWSESVAASLLALGLKPSDRALFQLGTTIGFFTAFYGCMKAGVILVCTLPQYRLKLRQRHPQILGDGLNCSEIQGGDVCHALPEKLADAAMAEVERMATIPSP